ncbi:MBL fold metallo-hydrolase [Tepidiphilus margaritifer]|uniref:MBL fold metallo-hydrolase n=1 Tax=Tepidiphilus margaritifer TaxID=203471 RepID=UPI00040BA595|nr:MBL fold metallo-hydrolase [Tepidiphilus margaritifer]
MLHVLVIPVTPFEQNCSLLWCDRTGEAAVIDPGGDLERIEEAIRTRNLNVRQILLTHGHIDHAAGAPELARRLGGIPIIGPQEEERFWLQALPEQARTFGFGKAEAFLPDQWLEEGDTVSVGEHALEVLHVPGHTPGHVVYFAPDERLAFVGDVLFAGSIGRTDFPRGNHRQLITGILTKLLPLGDDVRFVPGHGPMSTFGEERAHNPFLV